MIENQKFQNILQDCYDWKSFESFEKILKVLNVLIFYNVEYINFSRL